MSKLGEIKVTVGISQDVWLEDMLDQIKDQNDISPAQAIAQGLCVVCRKHAIPRCYSPGGRLHYRVSGTCEMCSDIHSLMRDYRDHDMKYEMKEYDRHPISRRMGKIGRFIKAIFKGENW